MAPDEINVYLWRRGFHLFFPMRGTDHWRVVGIVPAALRGKDDLRLDDVIPSIREEAGTGLSFQSSSWFSTYRISHRRAARFRDRRCFLLGDAAHIHSPVGAQGMNTGLQDAYNLAWKLALVVSGKASAALLDSYADERIPVARQLLRSTDRAFALVVSDAKLAQLLRTRLFPKILALALRFERLQRLAFRTISQIGIQYRAGPLSQSLPGLPRATPKAGDRFPWLRLKLLPDGPAEDLFQRLDDTKFNLVMFGQPAPQTAASGPGDLLRTLAIPSDPSNELELERARIPNPSFYLLRPDGHIGLSGVRLETDTVVRYLTERLTLSS
jgi:hypothetical protein